MTDRMHTREGWNPQVIAEGLIWLRDAETGEDVDLEAFERDAFAVGAVRDSETLAEDDCDCAYSWFPGAFAPCDGPYGIQACDGCAAHGDDFDTAYAVAAHLQGLTGRSFAVWYEAEPVIFASKAPRDLNSDPKPLVCGYITRDDRHPAGTGGLCGATHNPRAEYDHAQHNEPNPILRGARLDAASVYGSQGAAAQAYLDHINERGTVRTAAAGLGVWTLDHIDHARRVLTRLISVLEPHRLAEQETHA